MTGYIILAVFIVLVISHTAVFFTGYSRARKAAAQERAEDERRKLQSEVEFQNEKETILKEVKTDAEKKKASLSAGTSGRDRFDAINSSLQNHPKN
jgi:cell division protein FtsL